LAPHAVTQLAPSAATIYPAAHVSHVDASEHSTQLPIQVSHTVLELGKCPTSQVIQSVAALSVHSLQLLTTHVSATQVTPSKTNPGWHCTHVFKSALQSRQSASEHAVVQTPARSCLLLQNVHWVSSHRAQSV
jgi:hypothetical protein